jgi:hypothetical protein
MPGRQRSPTLFPVTPDVLSLTKQRSMAVALIVFLGCLLNACSALSYKEPPVSASTARVRFATDAGLPAVLRVYDDPSCRTNEQEWLRVQNGHPIRQQPKRLGIALWTYSDAAAKEIVVAADKEIYAMFFGGDIAALAVRTCGVPFTSRFLPGHDYEVFFSWSPNACSVQISEIAGGDAPQKHLLASFSNRTDDSNSACMQAFEKKRLY